MRADGREDENECGLQAHFIKRFARVVKTMEEHPFCSQVCAEGGRRARPEYSVLTQASSAQMLHDG